MITNTELREQGMRLFNELYGNGAGEELRKDMADLCPDFTDISIDGLWEASLHARGWMLKRGRWLSLLPASLWVIRFHN